MSYKSYLTFVLLCCAVVGTAQVEFYKLYNFDSLYFTNKVGYNYREYFINFAHEDSTVYTMVSASDQYHLSKIDIRGNALKSVAISYDDIYSFTKPIISGNYLVAAYTNYAHEVPGYRIRRYDKDLNLVDSFQYFVKDTIKNQLNFYNLIEYKNYLIISGTTKSSGDPSKDYNLPNRLFWVDKVTMELDTIVTFDFEDSRASIQGIQLDLDGNLMANYWHIAYLDTTTTVIRQKNKVGLIKFNDKKEIIWQWDSGVEYNNESNYSFVQLADSTYVFKRGGREEFPDPKSHNLVCIDRNKNEKWSYDSELSISPGYKDITKMTLLKNGDIFGVGNMRWPITDTDWDSIAKYNLFYSFDTYLNSKNNLFQSPFVFRMSPTGKKIWQKSLLEMDDYDRVSTGSISDAIELEDGTLLLCGYAGKVNGPIKSESQRLSYNWYSTMIRLSADGCLLDYPCTNTKIYLQPSRVLPYFNTHNVWLLFDPATSSKTYARFSKKTKMINQYDYYVLQFSNDSLFNTTKDTAYYRVVNEKIYALHHGKERLVFDYHVFKTEELNDTISLDTSYFLNLLDTIKAKQFIYSSNYNKSTKFHYINGIGCIEDFLFNSYISNNTLPIYQICKFWNNNKLIFNNEDLLCTPDKVIDPVINDIIISPNPTFNLININSSIPNLNLEVYNHMGKLLLSHNLVFQITIDLSSYQSGQYIFVVKDSKGNVIKSDKIVKI